MDKRVPGAGLPQAAIDAANKVCTDEAEQLRGELPKLAMLMDEAESDVLAFMSFL